MIGSTATSKNILLLGANGRTGRLVLARALAAGHRVTAVVREASRLPDVTHQRLEVIVGSACEPAFLRSVMPGHDVVISTLGPRMPSRGRAAVYSDSASAIVPAMEAAGVQRVLVTSSGLLFPDDGFKARALRWLVPAIVRATGAMEEVICSSDRDWTIARTGFLTDGDTRAFSVSSEGIPPGSGAISRNALAEFLVSEVERPSHRREVVGLADRAPLSSGHV